jgi:7-keto-8-aminopelargonate synthetase-like enzyme
VSELKQAIAPWSEPNKECRSAIVPLLVGDEAQAVGLAAALRNQGILAPAIRYPTVARGSARLRFTVTADHIPQDTSTLATVLRLMQRATRNAEVPTRNTL